jgi:hypothetical protein
MHELINIERKEGSEEARDEGRNMAQYTDCSTSVSKLKLMLLRQQTKKYRNFPIITF